MVKNILFVLLGLFFFLFLMGNIFIKQMAEDPGFAEMKPPPKILDEPAPSPFEGLQAIRLSDGDTVMLNTGNSLAFVSFWATWCRPCLSEMPTIEKLYQAQKDKMAFFVISTEDAESRIRVFMERKGYTFPAYRLVNTPVTDSLTHSLPLSFLSHNAGLHIYHRGAANWNSRVVHQLVEKLAEGT
ncbi:MAG: TlpA family protein disulfide reductase [Phaeodactylibacter sp.]|nr:TlpA family protein disulfide reductase [Phaeodactylibacter sp.]MCB9048882.1 TlpA family protein disulfide reductase [Lewinellaceae bacterium]